VTSTTPTVPYILTRLGVVMTPEPGNDLEAEGVLNPASGRTPDGRLHLLPRLVASGNVSRVGLAEVVLDDGVPVGVERRGVVLEPDEGWERGLNNAGVEDPRITWVPRLGVHLMTYVAYGPLGPRLALAVSEDLRHWRRLGPLHFAYQPDLDTDLNLFPNKDAVFFPEPVPGPDGEPAYAMLHRPMWDLGWFRPGEGVHLPAGLTDERPGIWVSYVPAVEVERDLRALVRQRDHRLVALSAHPFEELKIGAGPAPIRVEEGWLLIHHGSAGTVTTSQASWCRKRSSTPSPAWMPAEPTPPASPAWPKASGASSPFIGSVTPSTEKTTTRHTPTRTPGHGRPQEPRDQPPPPERHHQGQGHPARDRSGPRPRSHRPAPMRP
jgi:predicted GH43/DUF377 family glycosyl hydrolase